MAGASNIEWTEHTWNPIVGCSIVSPGCTNCYAMKMAARLDAMGQQLYKGLTKPSKAGAVWRGTIRRASDDVLLAPLRRKKPTTYFVNSMSDLFYETFPDEWIDQVFAVMALSPQHTFQVLTKGPARMLAYFDATREDRVWKAQFEIVRIDGHTAIDWPLPNVWLGVSAERQQEADERIPLLLQTPAAVRFVSAEPLIGPIDFTRIHTERWVTSGEVWLDAFSCRENGKPQLNWIIVGGESGPNARPMHPDWARAIRDQCAAAGVAFFFKQWGEYHPSCVAGERVVDGHNFADGVSMARLGKKAAGRLLDGKEHSAMPKVTV